MAGKEIRIGKKFIGPNHPLKASIVGRQTGSRGIVPEDQVPELLAGRRSTNSRCFRRFAGRLRGPDSRNGVKIKISSGVRRLTNKSRR